MSNQRKISFRKLRNIIVDLYPTEVSQRRIAQDAGLNLKQINISGSPVEAWNAILTEAENATMMYALLEVVCSPDEYGTKVELRTACDNYLASIAENGELPPVGPPAKTIPGWFLLVGRLLVVITFVYLFIAFVLRDQLGHRERFLFILAVALTGGGSAFFLGAWAKGNEIISLPILPDDYLSFGVFSGLLTAIILLVTTFNVPGLIPPMQPPIATPTPTIAESPDATVQVAATSSTTVPTTITTAKLSETATPSPQPTTTPLATATTVPVITATVATATPSSANILTSTLEVAPTSSCPTVAPFLLVTSTIDNMPMVCIPGGEFLRGNNNGAADEQPEAQIYLDEFYIDQHEVTNRMYRDCVTTGPCATPTRQPDDHYDNETYNDFPVVNVTWDQAQRYCKFRSKRLPAEAEWEKAARGPEGNIYPWKNSETTNDIRLIAMRTQNVQPVGKTAQDVSGYQVYDMGSNVREWVYDHYSPNSTRKVVRGGSWIEPSDNNNWKATRREGYSGSGSAVDLGFRCAADKSPDF